jgi:hypothetical protein
MEETQKRRARGEKWIDEELAGCQFRDVRLGKRLRSLIEQLGQGPGQSIPWACQDWASTKAAYRFFANDGIRAEQILAGHFQSTRERLPAGDELLLVVHDTTEFSYKREDVAAVGLVSKGSVRKDKQGQPVFSTTCGICQHASLAVTTEGLPLGLVAVKFWSRKEFKGRKQRRKAHNAAIEQKESYRWLENLRDSTARLGQARRCVHIADQEGDIYDLFGMAQQLGTHFLIRTRADRLADGGPQTVAERIRQAPRRGLYRIAVRDQQGKPSVAVLEIRYRRVQIQTPKGKKKRFPELTATVIEAQERETPRGREQIDWKLITDLPVASRHEAIEKVQWFSLRWKIESFHKIMNSGCKAEQARLRTAARLTNLLAVFCILSWRIFWLTMMNRCAPGSDPRMVFTALEMQVLDRLVQRRPRADRRKAALSVYLIKLAQLGGYLARRRDSPPGNTVIWRGMSRLVDIEIGVLIGAQLVGN